MNYALNTVIVDDSLSDSTILKDLLSASTLAHVKHVYNDPKVFIEKVPLLDFDLCLLDIGMPEMDGFVVAQLLHNKSIIFVTGMDTRLKEALTLNPIDVVTKPIHKDRLDHAIEKAYRLMHFTKEYALFNVAESNRKVKIHLPDIAMVSTDEVDPRHKDVVMKDGTIYTLMDCTLEYLLDICSKLAQVNRTSLVSLDAVYEVTHDLVSLEYTSNNVPQYKELTLSRTFRQSFFKILSYKS